ncbi:hypothetical protein HMPREF0557_01683 [Listeria innocua ATCC 33091]|uniref:Uncharacterized protein n=1 Tax=Listeria innocua ATCC 33091 TaxID=1002366 RepID=A0AB72Z8L2_LISIO|nr:hypothetical protein HMPREF0557_01683 [Listeria innocua ATCC 33091]
MKEIRYGEKTRYEEICKKALPRAYYNYSKVANFLHVRWWI